jgi:hypothetical protein
MKENFMSGIDEGSLDKSMDEAWLLLYSIEKMILDDDSVCSCALNQKIRCWESFCSWNRKPINGAKNRL